MTAAIFGLLGVIVGAVVNGAVSYVLGRQRERAEGRAAARLVGFELRDHASTLRAVLDRRSWEALGPRPPDTSEWDAHRAVLARVFDDDEWSTIAQAYSSIIDYAHVYRSDAKRTALSDDVEPRVREVEELAVEGVFTLGAHARGVTVAALKREYPQESPELLRPPS